MKKAFRLFGIVCFVAALFTMTSCTKSQEDLIVGTWKVTSVASQPASPLANLIIGATFTFNADNTCILTAYGQSQAGTYAITDGKLSITTVDDGEVEVQSMEIKSLDKKKMALYMEDAYLDENGNLITVKMTLNFDKQ